MIVLGVLIALAAQQAAQSVNERREAAETRATLTGEIEESLAVLELRLGRRSRASTGGSSSCAESSTTGAAPAASRSRAGSSQATWFAFDTARFEAAQSAGRLALYRPSEEQYRFGLMAESLRMFRDIQRRETDAWSTLRMLQSGPDTLSPSDRTAVRVALQDASTLNHFAQISVGQTLPQAASFGWRPNMRRVQQRMRLAWKDGRFRPSVCLPIDTPPDQAHREANLIYPLPE